MHLTLAASVIVLAVFAAATPQPVDEGAGMAIPIFKRSDLANADKSVNFEALTSHAAYIKAKIARGFDNYERNTGKQHPSAVKAKEVSKRTGGLPLSSMSTRSWFGNISVGTPPENFIVQFDTASADLFIPSVMCDSSCDQHNRWDPAKSTSSHDLGQKFEFDLYGTASCELYTDNVLIAGSTATNQTFGAALHYSSQYSWAQNAWPGDGVIGMGFPVLSYIRANPIFETLIEQNQVTDQSFSLKISASGAGELFIGGSNKALHKGDFHYVDVAYPAFWSVFMDSVQGNGQTVLKDVSAIIDTSSYIIMGHPKEVAALYEAIGGTLALKFGEGYYYFPCDKFPTITFTFGGRAFKLAPSTLIIGTDAPGSPNCVSGLIANDLGATFWNIGASFLQNVYTRFDYGRQQVGFADLA